MLTEDNKNSEMSSHKKGKTKDEPNRHFSSKNKIDKENR